MIEIERKFLVRHMNIPLELANVSYIHQVYLKYKPEVRIRRIISHDTGSYTCKLKHKLTIKSKGTLKRLEFEIGIPEFIYKMLYKHKKSELEKTRYTFRDGHQEVYVDKITSPRSLKDIIVAEVEFKSEEDAKKFVLYDWMGQEVTRVSSYKSKNLARIGKN